MEMPTPVRCPVELSGADASGAQTVAEEPAGDAKQVLIRSVPNLRRGGDWRENTGTLHLHSSIGEVGVERRVDL